MNENPENSRTKVAAGLGLTVLLGLALTQCPEKNGIASPISRAPKTHQPDPDLERLRRQISGLVEGSEEDTARETANPEAQVKITEPIQRGFEAFRPLYDCMRSNPDVVCTQRSNLFTSVMSCYPQSNPEAVPVEFTDFSMFSDEETPDYLELSERNDAMYSEQVARINANHEEHPELTDAAFEELEELDAANYNENDSTFRMSVAPASNILAFHTVPEQWVKDYSYNADPENASAILTEVCNHALDSFIKQAPSVETICEGSDECEEALDRSVEERDDLEEDLEKINFLANQLSIEGIEWTEGFDSFHLGVEKMTFGNKDTLDIGYINDWKPYYTVSAHHPDVEDLFTMTDMHSNDDVLEILDALEDTEE